jgi:hypothetical protein
MPSNTASTPETNNWPALLRGSVLSSVQSKHVQYISLADRRAQVIVTINAFLIPLILSSYKSMPEIRLGILIVVVCAALSIFFAVMSLMPKRYRGTYLGTRSRLHFSGIWGYSEAEYLEHMRSALDERTTITEYMVSDIYHLSHDVLRPKFFWIRLSFYAFLTGLAASLIFVVAPLFLSF